MSDPAEKKSAELDTCGCCDSGIPNPPLYNPPGQDELAYRIGTYASFRRRMVARLARERPPGTAKDQPGPLAGLTTRSSDDFAMALLDAWAVVGDVLTFYQERIANEGYLRTADERRSVLELARAIGYELNPGVSAEVYLAFTVDKSDSTPDSATIPAGTQVQSIPQGQGELPQTFETGDAFTAHVAWNEWRPRLTKAQEITMGTTELYLADLATNLEPGDRLLIIDQAKDDAEDLTSDLWDVRRVVDVQPEPKKSRTLVKVEAGNNAALPTAGLRVYAFRQTAGIFGHNVVSWPSLANQSKADYLNIAVDDLQSEHMIEWPYFDIYAPDDYQMGEQWMVEATPRAVADAAIQAADSRAKAMTRSALASIAPALSSGGQAIASIPGILFDSVPDLTASSQNIADSIATIINSINIVDLPDIAPLRDARVPDNIVNVPEWMEFMGHILAHLNNEIVPALGAVPRPSVEYNTVSEQLGKIFEELNRMLLSVNPVAMLGEKYSDKRFAPVADALSNFGETANIAAAAGAATVYAATLRVALESLLLLDPDTEDVKEIAFYANRAARNIADPTTIDSSESPWAVDEADLGVIDTTVDRDDLTGMLLPIMGPGLAPIALMGSGVVEGVEQVADAVYMAVEVAASPAAKGRFFATGSANQVDLDSQYDKILPDQWLLLKASGSQMELYRIAQVDEISRAEYMITGKVSRITVEASPSLAPFANLVRETTVYGAPEELEIAPVDETDLVENQSVELDGLIDPRPSGPFVILTGQKADSDAVYGEVLRLSEFTTAGNHTRLHFEGQLARKYQRDTVTLYGNVVHATHGETVNEEVLGHGDGSASNQRFRLKKPPLTHTSAASASGADSALTLRVNGIEWQQGPSLYGLGSDEKRFLVRIDDDANASVIFGDGKSGARLPTGQENVRATYRSGIGLGGQVGADTLTMLKKRPFGVSAVNNPIEASGGEDPEKLEMARVNAPRTVLTLDRVVSLRDYADFARAFAGIGKASAVAVWNGEQEWVVITIASSSGDKIDKNSSIYTNLRDAIAAARDPLREVQLAEFELEHFDMAAKVLKDEAYAWETVKAEIEAALVSAFSFPERGFGQPVTAAEVIRIMHEIEGVSAVDIDTLAYKNSTTRSAVLEAQVAHYDRVNKGIQLAQLLLINEAGITLTEMAP